MVDPTSFEVKKCDQMRGMIILAVGLLGGAHWSSHIFLLLSLGDLILFKDK